MAYDQALATRISKIVGRRKGFTERKIFGGVGYLLHGNMCVGVWKDSLIARLDPSDYDEALRRPGAAKFDITGKPMAGWVMVAPAGIAGDELRGWIMQSINYVSALPKK
jgi:hypothetical protein